MQLNDGKGTISGRKVQLDTANGNQNKRGPQQRRQQQGDGNVDGSRFRGGKYNNRRSNEKDDGPPKDPKERPSLKLAPRTKAKADEGKGDKQGSSDIFGGARARDAQAWEENRKSTKQHSNGDNHQKGDGDRRRPAPGGRGGRGGRGGGRGAGVVESTVKRTTPGKRESKQKLISPEEKAAAAAAKAAVEAAAPTPVPTKPAVPTNKFALLMDSDSD